MVNHYGPAMTATTCDVLVAAREARVLDTEERPIKGHYAASELVGGLFYVNAPAGAGLTSGAVFDRIAGGGTVDGADREAGQ